jgi:hypothetical protein
MARGWESKSVEAQQEEVARPRPPKPTLTAQQRANEPRRRTLELARTRAASDLTRASSPAHRTMLEQTLVAIDEQLAQLNG